MSVTVLKSSMGYSHYCHSHTVAQNVYQSWLNWLTKAKDFKAGRPDGKHGRIKPVLSQCIVFQYQETPIVFLYIDGSIIIANGGYKTRTTKKRINKIIKPHGYEIRQINFMWVLKRIDEDEGVALDNNFVVYLQSDSVFKPSKKKGSELQ